MVLHHHDIRCVGPTDGKSGGPKHSGANGRLGA
jgi:hypothetical protein